MCMCICVTCVLSLHVFAWLCFVYLNLLCLLPVVIIASCIGTKMHRVLNISLTSIHPIQLPHPWMQWHWPYQWEILTTQKVGRIKNPPSVCPSSLSVCPPRPLCPTASTLWKIPHDALILFFKGILRHYGKYTYLLLCRALDDKNQYRSHVYTLIMKLQLA